MLISFKGNIFLNVDMFQRSFNNAMLFLPTPWFTGQVQPYLRKPICYTKKRRRFNVTGT